MQQQQHRQATQPPTIAKRPTDPASSYDTAKPVAAKEGGAKVLSIGGDSAKPKAKVLSIGAPAPPKEDAVKNGSEDSPAKAEAGNKVTAAKAIDKTGTEKTNTSGKTSPTPSSGRSSPSRDVPAKGPARAADAVEKEQAADVDDETLKEIYGKEHVNIVFIGHVDAGVSIPHPSRFASMAPGAFPQVPRQGPTPQLLLGATK